MRPIIDFQDAVTAGNLDPDADYAVYYVDGAYANYEQVRARCPHARLFGITVLGQTGPGIFACDSENGDMPVAKTIMWVATQLRLGVDLICVYANLDRWDNLGLKDALDRYGHRIRRWVAEYTGDPYDLPDWADADQYAGNVDGVDRNVAVANFFGTTTPAHFPAPRRQPARRPAPRSGLSPADRAALGGILRELEQVLARR